LDDPIRVAIVDDDGAFRQAGRGWFDGAGDIVIVGTAQSERETLHWLYEVHPDVVLLDVAAASQVREISVLARVIVLHLPGQEALALEALRAGALGHLDKQNTRPPQAIAAVRAVSRGEAVLSPPLAGWMLDEITQRRRQSDHEAEG